MAAVMPAAYLRRSTRVPELVRNTSMLDWQVIVFTAAVCTLTCLLFALAPALRVTRRTIPLGSLDRGATRAARLHLRGGFLALQIAACTVLLIGAGLVTRAIAHAMTFDPGFRVEGIHRVRVSLPSDVVAGDFPRQLIDALERDLDQPVATAYHGIFVDFPFTMGIALPGEAPHQHRQVTRRSISSRYFEVLGIPLVRGRMFATEAKGEVVTNEAFARTYYPGADPVGGVIRQIDDKGAVAGTHTIVGVVRDAYRAGLEQIPPSCSGQHPAAR